jgi:predicted molibdopterin-dependent oxidoreductase YjgC
MSSPGPLLHPYEKLVKITIMDKEFMVPDQNTLLRAFQFLASEHVSYGRFCWNEDCQYCRVTYDTGEGTPVRKAISCKLMVEDGMRVVDAAAEIKYCLRSLELSSPTPK